MSKLLARIMLIVTLAPACAAAQDIVLDRMLVIERVGRYGRTPVFVDPIEHARVMGTWRAPKAGEAVTAADGQTRAWREATAGEGGWIRVDAGGYALANVESEEPRVMILEASGHGVAIVNGEPRAGDPYEMGYVRLPVLLKKGSNELLFHVARGRVRAKLVSPTSDVCPDPADATTPDFIRGRAQALPFGVVYVNATTQPVAEPARIAPLSVRKVAREMRYDGGRGGGAGELTDDATGVRFRVREPGQTYKRTFLSDIDGSVQCYAINPRPRPRTDVDDDTGALVLSLHGAAVEATSQADAYAPKPWADIVCPTNRRPFGFDWEDWGRLDALEALDDATRLLKPDPSRIYLTGHSMGGHGTWIIGALLPDRFAAIAPSAGWISFSTYGAATQPRTQPSTQPATMPVAEVMRRAASTSETSLLFPNLAHHGIYILHGADDDNVPVDQARRMVEHLGAFHHDFVYHEQPGAGHWWDDSDEPGADCVDWPPMFDFLARHRRPEASSVRQVEFTAVNPGVSSRCHWVSIEAQQRALEPSAVKLRVDPHGRRFVGTTRNVERLAIDLVHFASEGTIEVDLDGQLLDLNFPRARAPRLWLLRDRGTWQAIDPPSPDLKNPQRCGPFKDAFRNRVVFVYGTGGTLEENAWALAKARFDAETFWYRGNGSIEVVPDTEFDAGRERDRNVILYGNANTNARWDELLSDSPVQLKRGELRIGQRVEAGADLACLLIRPRLGSDGACVGVVGGTGIVGMRATDRLPIFLSGVAYPDFTILRPTVFERGVAGVRAAGFFGNDWSLERGDAHFAQD